MTRNEFEASFMNYDMPQVRHAHLMKALAIGPSVPVGVAPTLYNELYFLACYSLLQRHATRKAASLMAFHCMPRNGNTQPGDPGALGMNPWELLVDPVHRGSEAHRNIITMSVMVNTDYITKHPVQDGQGDRPLQISQENKAGTLTGMFRPMVSQLWLHGYPLRDYLAAIGNVSHDQLIAQTSQNRDIVLADPQKAKWLNDRIGRAMGTTELSRRYGVTFDAVQVGLRGQTTRWVMGHTRVVIGNRRG